MAEQHSSNRNILARLKRLSNRGNRNSEGHEDNTKEPSSAKDLNSETKDFLRRTNSRFCRICHDSDSNEKLESPCLCKGTLGLIHLSCLETWLQESNTNSCEICGFIYLTVRTPKYRPLESFCVWLRYPNNLADGRNICFDTCSFVILTPLAVLASHLCFKGAMFYFERDFTDFPTAKWTAIGLFALMATLLLAYHVWLLIICKHHIKAWHQWYRLENVVRVVPHHGRIPNANPNLASLNPPIVYNPSYIRTYSLSNLQRTQESVTNFSTDCSEISIDNYVVGTSNRNLLSAEKNTLPLTGDITYRLQELEEEGESANLSDFNGIDRS